jgi:hypothetical protein
VIQGFTNCLEFPGFQKGAEMTKKKKKNSGEWNLICGIHLVDLVWVIVVVVWLAG